MDTALILSLALGLAGMATHQLKQMIQAQVDGGESFSWGAYWTKNWPQTMLALVGTGALLGIAHWQAELTPLVAYLAGITGNTAAEVIGSRKTP